MKKKWLAGLATVVVLVMAALLVRRLAFGNEAPGWRLVKVEKGDIEATVSATGTLGAVTTVQVGTQVSGQLAELFVDFNDQVKKGQLLARIDPTLQQQAVTDAQASLERARAQVLQASRENNRNEALRSAGLVPRSEAEKTDSALDVARASMKSAQVALDRARQNLRYTNIYAPIDGVVVERNVDLGQTVAASLSAPQLFLIAEDLTNMQILAKVGESDIAGISQGQTARFTVQALSGRTFEGTVEQVRLQSTTTENVVNYTVVVRVPNADRKLLPGMTARVNFLTAAATDVLKVPNAALRFKPPDDVKVDAPATSTAPRTGGAERGGARREGGGAAGRVRRSPGASGNGGGAGTLYYLGASGELKAARVRTGLTDGSFTVVRGPDVREGMEVVAGTLQAQSSPQSTNPFQGTSTAGQRGPRGPGGF